MGTEKTESEIEERERDFDKQKSLLEFKEKFEEIRHQNKMEELAYERETNALFFEKQLEIHRIKSKDIKESMMMKRGFKRHDPY